MRKMIKSPFLFLPVSSSLLAPQLSASRGTSKGNRAAGTAQAGGQRRRAADPAAPPEGAFLKEEQMHHTVFFFHAAAPVCVPDTFQKLQIRQKSHLLRRLFFLVLFFFVFLHFASVASTIRSRKDNNLNIT